MGKLHLANDPIFSPKIPYAKGIVCLKENWQQDIHRTVFESKSGNGTPLQYSCLENPMDGGAWWAAVHGVTKSRTRLSDFTFIFHFRALEKEMATHSSVFAWRIPERGAWWTPQSQT